MEKVTINTLAEELGLSVCTINKALNGKPKISVETRSRVQKAALRLGYRPNPFAQALASPAITIGMIYPDAWPGHYGLLIEGVRQGFEELQNHRILPDYYMVSGYRDGEDFVKGMQTLAGRKIAGMIICFGLFEPQYFKEACNLLIARHIPFVFLGDDNPSVPRLTCVRHDSHRCGKIAAEILGWTVKDRSVGLFVGTRNILDHKNKIRGFQNEAKRYSSTLEGIYETHDDPKSAYPAAHRMFTEHPGIEGIYIGSENATGICQYLVDHGLAGKVKVIATGNSPFVQQMIDKGVVQCSLFQNEQQQGKLSVQVLFRYLKSAQMPSREVLVPPTLLLRNTLDLCGPATLDLDITRVSPAGIA